MIFQAILGISFWTKAYNAYYFVNYSSSIVFVLKTLFDKDKYVLVIKNNGIDNQVKLESES